MFTGWPWGWWNRYPLNRPITNQEIEERLDVQYGSSVPMHSQLVLKLNGTFLEVADRTQHHRGGLILLFGTLLFPACMLIAPLWLFLFEVIPPALQWFQSGGEQGSSLWESLFSIGVIIILILIGFYYMSWPIIKFNLFSYRYYPIRFNRKNRQVYVFTREGGVKKLPFDQIYWNIGRSRGWDKDLTDIRGHEIDEKGIIRYTFNAGPYAGLNEEYITFEYWRFICRYMKMGETGVVESEYDRVIVENYKDVSWISSLRFQYMRTPDFLWTILLPLQYLTAAFHLLCMKLSKQPEWPEWVEKECALDPSDPPPWKEPEIYAAPIFDNPDPEYFIYRALQSGLPEKAAGFRRQVRDGTFNQPVDKKKVWKKVLIRLVFVTIVFVLGTYLYDWIYG